MAGVLGVVLQVGCAAVGHGPHLHDAAVWLISWAHTTSVGSSGPI